MRLPPLISSVLVLCALPFALLAQERTPRTLSFDDIAGALNPQCVAYVIVGACPITPLQATHVLVEYWDPIMMIETTPRTGESAIGGDVFDALSGVVGIGTSVVGAIAGSADELESGGGGRVANVAGNSNLWFNEARVYTIPSLVGATCGLCSQAATQFQVNYLTDTDALWRSRQKKRAILELPRGFGLMGVWQRVYPRVGFAIHSSDHVAGAIAAVRAAWIAFDPIGIGTLPPDTRVVPQSTGVAPECWQLGYPRPAGGGHNRCYRPGIHPGYWDRGLATPDSTMIHFIWQRKTCCVDQSSSVCGLVFSSAGINFCPLLTLPGGIIAGLPLNWESGLEQ